MVTPPPVPQLQKFAEFLRGEERTPKACQDACHAVMPYVDKDDRRIEDAGKALPGMLEKNGPEGVLKDVCRRARHMYLTELAQRVQRERLAFSLGSNAQTSVVWRGNPQATIMAIAEAPSRHEDRDGVPFVGPSGELLHRILREVGLMSPTATGSLTPDVLLTNVCFHHPPENSAPSLEVLREYVPFVYAMVRAVRPTAIVAMGRTASHVVLHMRAGQLAGGKQKPIGDLLGKWWNVHVAGVGNLAVFPTYHPAKIVRERNALLRERDSKVLAGAFTSAQRYVAENPRDPIVLHQDASKSRMASMLRQGVRNAEMLAAAKKREKQEKERKKMLADQRARGVGDISQALKDRMGVKRLCSEKLAPKINDVFRRELEPKRPRKEALSREGAPMDEEDDDVEARAPPTVHFTQHTFRDGKLQWTGVFRAELRPDERACLRTVTEIASQCGIKRGAPGV